MSSRSGTAGGSWRPSSRITPKKPVVAIKAGASAVGQKAASSHTGSLAGSHAVYLAAFRQAGVIPVNSIRGAFQTAELLASEGYPKGTRAVVITNAGGFGVLSSDYAEQNGIEMVEFSEELIRNWTRCCLPTGAGQTRSTWWGIRVPTASQGRSIS